MHKTVSQAPAHAGEYVALPEVVVGFLNGLRRVPVGEWAEAARNAETAGPADAPHLTGSAASATLRRIVARMPRVAKQTQQRVLNMVEVAQGCVDDDVTAAMRRVALNAALALATRESLGDEAFAQLYGPFDELIPLRDEPPITAAWDTVIDPAAVAQAS